MQPITKKTTQEASLNTGNTNPDTINASQGGSPIPLEINSLASNEAIFTILSLPAEIHNKILGFVKPELELNEGSDLSHILEALQLEKENIDRAPITSQAKADRLHQLQSFAIFTLENASLQSLDLANESQYEAVCEILNSIKELAPFTDQIQLVFKNVQSVKTNIDPEKFAFIARHFLQDVTVTVADDESTTLDGIEALASFKHISLISCPCLNDLAPLATISELQSLVSDCLENVTDLEPLGTLSKLQRLELYGLSNVGNLVPLSTLSELQNLELFHVQNVTDLAALAGLSKLQSLELDGLANVGDLAALAGLSRLQSLAVYNAPNVRDLAPLAILSKLQSLVLHKLANVGDLAPLTTLPELQNLVLDYLENVIDLAPLVTLPKLLSLQLNFLENVTDLAPLEELPVIRDIKLDASMRRLVNDNLSQALRSKITIA